MVEITDKIVVGAIVYFAQEQYNTLWKNCQVEFVIFNKLSIFQK